MNRELLDRWRCTWERTGLEHAGSDGHARALDDLVDAYAAPPRAYHALDHVLECLDHLDGAPDAEVGSPQIRGEIELALWYHDAVYDSRASDNEQRSADMAAAVLTPLDPGFAERVTALILATRHTDAPTSPPAALIVDVDLAILGAEADRFDAYERQIREEYAWVADADFARGRAAVFEQFAARDRIYATDHFHGRFETAARTNLGHAITAWRARG
ncbi:MAG: N-methyl-D-aspartate receptor NMDAR2C subunit [Phycisphaerales bacterium]